MTDSSQLDHSPVPAEGVEPSLYERLTEGELLDGLDDAAEWIETQGPRDHQTPWLIHRDVVREAMRRLAAQSAAHRPQEAPEEVPTLAVTRQAILDMLVKHGVLGAREALDRLIVAARQQASAAHRAPWEETAKLLKFGGMADPWVLVGAIQSLIEQEAAHRAEVERLEDEAFESGRLSGWEEARLDWNWNAETFGAIQDEIDLLKRAKRAEAEVERLTKARGEVVVTGSTSDGYHTFDELYAYRMAYNAVLFNEWAAQGKYGVHKSMWHSDGQPCFGGGWFIVVAQLPTGMISNHYKIEHWDLFQCEARPKSDEYDGHTPQVALERLLAHARADRLSAEREQP